MDKPRWLKEHADFRELYTREGGHGAYLVSEIIEIADDARNDWAERNGERVVDNKMVIVGDRETAENTDAGGYETKQKRVYGDGHDKGNDCAIRGQDHEARVQREQFRVVLQKFFALDDAANEAIQQSGDHEDGKIGMPLDEGGKAVGRRREQGVDRLEILVVEEPRVHLRRLGRGRGVDLLLLHGFVKKTQRTPNEEIKLAEKRFKEWQRGET